VAAVIEETATPFSFLKPNTECTPDLRRRWSWVEKYLAKDLSLGCGTPIPASKRDDDRKMVQGVGRVRTSRCAGDRRQHDRAERSPRTTAELSRRSTSRSGARKVRTYEGASGSLESIRARRDPGGERRTRPVVSIDHFPTYSKSRRFPGVAVDGRSLVPCSVPMHASTRRDIRHSPLPNGEREP